MSQSSNVATIHHRKKADSNTTILQQAANELIFAVVGHVGSGTSVVAKTLANILRDSSLSSPYEVQIIKATDVITAWAKSSGRPILPSQDGQKKTLDNVMAYQNIGDAMRLETGDHAAVAKAFAIKIRELRAAHLKINLEGREPVMPDGALRAYILDSIRHPAEVELLRHIYQDAFFLMGVVCEESKRLSRVTAKYADAGQQRAEQFMRRDAKAGQGHGQRVSDAFHLSDFFVDNTEERRNRDGTANPNWNVPEKLSRLLKIIRHSDIVRPEMSETAMLHAHGAAMRSACLSRQVGAALLDSAGNIVATGCNEVPRAGGGVYGETHSDEHNDHRCAYRHTQESNPPFCSNTQERNTIVEELLSEIEKIKDITEDDKERLTEVFKTGRVGGLLEFSRAVHAEMDAILSAGRNSISTKGTRLFVTAFPCHYCARHIVSAGIDEVQYIEPYPKSQALKLHSDSIVENASEWQIPSQACVSVNTEKGRNSPKVLFRPFTGVAPRLYRRAFCKDRELKDPVTGQLSMASPAWGSPWHLRRMSYAQLEAELAGEGWQ